MAASAAAGLAPPASRPAYLIRHWSYFEPPPFDSTSLCHRAASLLRAHLHSRVPGPGRCSGRLWCAPAGSLPLHLRLLRPAWPGVPAFAASPRTQFDRFREPPFLWPRLNSEPLRLGPAMPPPLRSNSHRRGLRSGRPPRPRPGQVRSRPYSEPPPSASCRRHHPPWRPPLAGISFAAGPASAASNRPCLHPLQLPLPGQPAEQKK